MSEKKKKDYVQLVADTTNRNYEDVKREMLELKETVGVKYKEYYENELYLYVRTQQHITGRRIVKKRIASEKLYQAIEGRAGLNKAEVNRHIRQINKLHIIRIDLEAYSRFQIHDYEGEELVAFLHLLKRRKELKRSIREKFILIDKGELTYEDIQAEADELFDICQKTLPVRLVNWRKSKICISRPDLASDEEKLLHVAIDMEFTKFLLNFTFAEYVSFGFVDKTIAEKREFVTDVERLILLREINDISKFELLDDKYQAYQLLKPYYGRRLLCINSLDDYNQFREFCAPLRKIVVKPFYESLGRGVKAVKLPRREKKRKALFQELCTTYNTFVVEELIVAHKAIKKLNPDSVNTVRMITYYNGKETIIHHPFMKVGKKGSFVDNGGAGGILIAIDPETGVLMTDGCDENGVVYEHHPDSKVKFKGYQLPNWEQAVQIAEELSTKIPGLSYIGWDLALDKDGNWIVVEGNARTQFFGQQATTRVGVRKELYETLNKSMF